MGKISMGIFRIDSTENNKTPNVITITAIGFFNPEDTSDMAVIILRLIKIVVAD